jgi:hypothetical protein
MALLSSCTLPEYIEVYNNSKDQITFELERGDKRIALTVGSGEKSAIGPIKISDTSIRVTRKEANLRYKATYPGSEYWSYIGVGPFKKIVVRLQYEEDGRISVLPRGHGFPIGPAVMQPQGYPLEGENGKESSEKR